MPFDGRAYRVLVASPGDVEEEREIVVRVIQEWNDLYAYTRKVVLLPLRWETHTAPEYGSRPQEVINRAIVDQCDLLVGVFWTRIGTPTGVADSGTLEEIARVAKAGKPVMLYFSKIGADPDRLDLDQLKRLKEFKTETYLTALTESYKSHVEFRDKFAKQLELKVRDLQRADNPNQPPPLRLLVDSGDAAAPTEETAMRDVELINVADLELLDSYQPEMSKRALDAINLVRNKAATLAVPLAIENTGTSGIRNLYVQLSVRISGGPAHVFDSRTGEGIRWWTRLIGTTRQGRSRRDDMDDGLTKAADGWNLTFEWDALQPQRVRPVLPVLFVRVESDAKVTFSAKVYADSFAEPLTLTADLTVKARTKQLLLSELIPTWPALLTDIAKPGQ